MIAQLAGHSINVKDIVMIGPIETRIGADKIKLSVRFVDKPSNTFDVNKLFDWPILLKGKLLTQTEEYQDFKKEYDKMIDLWRLEHLKKAYDEAGTVTASNPQRNNTIAPSDATTLVALLNLLPPGSEITKPKNWDDADKEVYWAVGCGGVKNGSRSLITALRVFLKAMNVIYDQQEQ